jgi:hypothetical protein
MHNSRTYPARCLGNVLPNRGLTSLMVSDGSSTDSSASRNCVGASRRNGYGGYWGRGSSCISPRMQGPNTATQLSSLEQPARAPKAAPSRARKKTLSRKPKADQKFPSTPSTQSQQRPASRDGSEGERPLCAARSLSRSRGEGTSLGHSSSCAPQ